VQAVSNVTAWLEEGCRAGLNGKQLYDKQDLFTIYIHRSPGASTSPPDSIFHGRDIEHRCTPCCGRVVLGVDGARCVQNPLTPACTSQTFCFPAGKAVPMA
jgi:hypothetical protein